MLTGINFNETKEYILKQEEGVENPTVFVLGHISKSKFFQIMKDVVNHKGDVDLAGISVQCTDLFAAGVKQVKNFRRTEGEEPGTFIGSEVMENLPPSVVMEVSAEVVKMNFLSEEDKKKSL